MKKLLISTLLFIAISIMAIAQSSNPWKLVHEKDFSVTGERSTIPSHYQTVKLGLTTLKNTLASAPAESFDGKKSDITLTLPMPDGRFESFYISESSVMDSKLAKQFPEIKSYLGTGVQNPSTYLRFDLTPQGFHAVVLGAEGNTVYIEPFATGEKELYIVYYNKDVVHTESEDRQSKIETIKENINANNMVIECGVIRTYRLAVAATGEYTIACGGTVAQALSAINTLVTYANGIFEKELHARLILVPGNTSVIFTNPNTDPYTSLPGFATQNQTTCDAAFTSAGYDIGFLVNKLPFNILDVFIFNNSVCNDQFKANNSLSHVSPFSAAFREAMMNMLGAQFGALDTRNSTSCGNGFPSVQAVETGAGSTIMGTPAFCTPAYQTYTDAYFSGASLSVLNASILGHTCAVDISTSNVAPTVDAGPDRTFPNNTKFVLNAVGTDEGNALTYCWEQIDGEIGNIMPPVSTATQGPVFRSYPPSTLSHRRFPKLMAGSSTWEKLPTVARTLKFRATVRDNSPAGGCTAADDMTVTVAGGAGTFVLTAPNGNGPGSVFSDSKLPICPTSNLTVAWDVAGTTLSPVNCTNVDILLSTSSGSAYQITLASNTPNDGIEVINLGNFNNIASPNCRVMVRSHWSDGTINYFFDDSDNDFVIDPAPLAFLNGSQSPAPMVNFVCINTKNTLKVVSPCSSAITMFPTSGSFPFYVFTSWDPANGLFSFKFSQTGSFAVTFRVMTPTGFSDRVYVFYGQNCGGGLVGPNTPGYQMYTDEQGESIEERIALKGVALQTGVTDDFVKLYPNPASASSWVTLEFPNVQGLSKIGIYDVKGALLQSIDTAEYRLMLDLSQFTPGTFFVKIDSPFFSITKKMIISE